MRPMMFAVGVGLTVCLASGAAQAANLVQNGGFESGFDGWTTTGNDLLQYVDSNASYHDDYVHSGNYSEVFGYNTDAHTLSQTLQTTVGTTYEISFFAKAFFPEQSNGSLCAAFGSTNAVCSGTHYTQDWQAFSGFATATSSSTLLQFVLGASPGNVALDDVSVTAVSMSNVPLPASLPMFGAAVIGLGAVGSRLRKKNRRVSA
jgi:hypothetical protein